MEKKRQEKLWRTIQWIGLLDWIRSLLPLNPIALSGQNWINNRTKRTIKKRFNNTHYFHQFFTSFMPIISTLLILLLALVSPSSAILLHKFNIQFVHELYSWVEYRKCLWVKLSINGNWRHLFMEERRTTKGKRTIFSITTFSRKMKTFLSTSFLFDDVILCSKICSSFLKYRQVVHCKKNG